jgi:hypothetical protein
MNPLEDLVQNMNRVSSKFKLSKLDVNNRGINPKTSEWTWVVLVIFNEFNDEMMWLKLERMNGWANSDIMLLSIFDKPLVQLPADPEFLLGAIAEYALK